MRLVQGKVAEQFGVSITPVREALHGLAAQGFVRMDARRGATVVGLTPADLADLYDLRKLLEGQAVRKACAFFTGEDFDALNAINQRMKQVREPDEWYRLNAHFHSALYGVSRNQHLCRIIEQLRQLSEPYVRIYVTKANLSDPVDEHGRVLTHCKNREPDLAEKALIEHLEKTADSVSLALEKVERRASGAMETEPR